MKTMMSFVFGLLLLAQAPARAQTPEQAIPSSLISLTPVAAAGQPLDVTIATAFIYRAYLDGATTTSTVLANPTCVAGPPVMCTFPIPATFPSGQHTMTVTEANAAGESLKSAAMTFVLTRPPGAPVSIHFIVGP